MNDGLGRINKQISILKIKLNKLNYPNIKLKDKVTILESSYYKLKTKNTSLEIKRLKKRVKNVFVYLKQCRIKDRKTYLTEKEIINRKLPIYSFFNDIKDDFILRKKFQDECQIRYILFSSYINKLEQSIKAKKLNYVNKNNCMDHKYDYGYSDGCNFSYYRYDYHFDDSTTTKYSKYQKYLTYVEDKELDKFRIFVIKKLIEKDKLVIYNNFEKLGKNFSYYFYRILNNHYIVNTLDSYFMEFYYTVEFKKNFQDILDFNLFNLSDFINIYKLNEDEINILHNFFVFLKGNYNINNIYNIIKMNNNIDYFFKKFDSFFEINQFSKKNELKEYIYMFLKDVCSNDTVLYLNSLNPIYGNSNSFLQIDFSMNDEALCKYVINAKKYFRTIQNDEIVKNSFNFNQQVKFNSLTNMEKLTKKDKNRLLGDLLFIFDCKAIGLSNDFILKQINYDSNLESREEKTMIKYSKIILDVIHNNKIFSFVSIL